MLLVECNRSVYVCMCACTSAGEGGNEWVHPTHGFRTTETTSSFTSIPSSLIHTGRNIPGSSGTSSYSSGSSVATIDSKLPPLQYTSHVRSEAEPVPPSYLRVGRVAV